MPKPVISTVIATYNSERTLELCLKSLRNQNYPQSKIELIVSDGGSSDNTLKIAKKYKAKIVKSPPDKQSAEYNKAYGIQFATGRYLLFIDSDNVLPHPEWLNQMLLPFQHHKSLVAVEPLRYHHQPSLSILNRYFALFGVNDPLPYYLGKADRMDYIHDDYNLIGLSQDKGSYFLVEFDSRNPSQIPTLGANGFLIKRSYFLKSNHKPGQYFHIDINVDIIARGHDQYAFIKDTILHLTADRFWPFIKWRAFVMTEYLEAQTQRRYRLFDPTRDKPKLLKYIFYALTIVKPFYDSLRGYSKVRDLAWFIHPVMCLCMVTAYSYGFLMGKVKK